ncbi:MAG: RNA pseudouridine synthase, partial [Rhodospirillales bacterium]|nr:RNA pseudouridine synthase [Rhodospirillales bacterium]
MSTETPPDATIRRHAPAEAAGQRVDQFLAEAAATLSRARVKTLIEAGHATRDGERLTQPGERVRP